ncbi:MAG: hypothetical protein JXA14_19220 [Anaerolineae bacterium]|nr:hypothetical protein [Anaerolineae bacterium]
MAKKGESQRRNPLASPGGGDLDPAVRAQLRQSAVRKGETEKITIRHVPIELSERIRQIAQNESGSIRAFSDVALALLERGLEAYEAGELEFVTRTVVVRTGVQRKK